MTVGAVTPAGSRVLGLKLSSFLRRGFAADHHGPARVNMWEAPGSPRKWKEEHFVFASLAGWGAIFFGGYKAATGGSKKREGHAPCKPAAAAEKPKRESKLSSARPEHKSAVVTPAKKLEHKSEPKPSTKPESRKKEARKEPEASVKPPPKKEGPNAKKISPSERDKQKKD